MTDQTLQRKGGRPPLPEHQPIIDSATCRIAITRETMRPGGGRVRQLAALHKLHKAMLAGEEALREEKRVTALEMTAHSQSELVSIRRAEYLRRFATTEHGAQALLKQVSSLQERVRSLELELAAVNSEEREKR